MFLKSVNPLKIIFIFKRRHLAILEFSLLSRFDGNEDGKISLKEMKKFIKDIHFLFQPSELQSVPEDQLADEAFKEMDSDHDGTITEEEFVNAAQSNNKICKMLALKVVNLLAPDE